MERTIAQGPPLETIFNFVSGEKMRAETICEAGSLGNPRAHALMCGHYISTRGIESCTSNCQHTKGAVACSAKPLRKAFVCPAGTCKRKLVQQEAASIRKTKRDARVLGLVHVWGLDADADEKQRLHKEKREARRAQRSTSRLSSVLVTAAEALMMGIGAVGSRGVNLLRQVVPQPEMDTDMDSYDLNTVVPPTLSTSPETGAEAIMEDAAQQVQKQAQIPSRVPTQMTATKTTALGATKTVFLDETDIDETASELADCFADTSITFHDGSAFRVNDRTSDQYFLFPTGVRGNPAPSSKYREHELNHRRKLHKRSQQRRSLGRAMGYREG